MTDAVAKLRGIAHWQAIQVDVKGHTAAFGSQPAQDASRVPFDIPVTGTVYGVLLNHNSALAALGEVVHEPPYQAPPKAPILYIKPVNTWTANAMPIPLPDGVPELEAGGALGVVIGQRATHIRAQAALSCVAGYTVVNDVSIPHDRVYRPAIAEKCRDGFCPIGPWLVHRGAVPNPDALAVRVYVNGELRQQASTADVIRPLARLIADVTEFMTLDRGDVLLTGVAAGAPRIKAGDVVTVDIDGVGRLQNVVVPEREVLAWTTATASGLRSGGEGRVTG